jgi:hypothetical protein
LLLLLKPALACKCAGSESVCRTVATSDAVFIGTVDSVELKAFPWDMSNGTRSPARHELERLSEDKSPQGVARLKEAFLLALPDLPEPYRGQLARATTSGELEELVRALFDRGRRIRFKMKHAFRGPKEDFVEVWSDFSECGYYFQTGETYLVYARRDRDQRLIATGGCTSRTNRLSDAGDDLAYLFFYENGGTESLRVNGFVTSSEEDLPWARIWDGVLHPVPDVVVELKSEHGLRYTNPDREGRFVFDGLPPGEYSISVFDLGYPGQPHLLQGPKTVDVRANSCASEALVVRPKIVPAHGPAN